MAIGVEQKYFELHLRQRMENQNESTKLPIFSKTFHINSHKQTSFSLLIFIFYSKNMKVLILMHAKYSIINLYIPIHPTKPNWEAKHLGEAITYLRNWVIMSLILKVPYFLGEILLLSAPSVYIRVQVQS